MRLLIVLLISFSVAAVFGLDEYYQKIRTISKKINNNPKLKALWEEHLERSKKVKLNDYQFNCDVSSDGSTPQNVHELKPKDFNLIAAYGDSITAGNGLGAEDLIDVAFQNRGEAWCVGGDKSLDEGVMTLANILRKYNSGLKGQSLDYAFVWEENSGLNAAVPGARAPGLVEQSDDLIEKLEYYAGTGDLDWENDWKMVTLLIGGNDLCGFCRDPEGRSPEKHAGQIRDALDKLHSLVPKVLVNLVPMFDVTPLRFISTDILCDLLQDQFCSCALNDTTRPALRTAQLGYYQKLKELAESGRYDTRDDFTVVLQPYMVDMEPPVTDDGEYDTSYFSPDCFHPGRKLHQAMGAGLWNSMLIPVQYKPRQMSFTDTTLRCPTQSAPYIFTNVNSGLREMPPKGLPSGVRQMEQEIAKTKAASALKDIVSRAKNNPK